MSIPDTVKQPSSAQEDGGTMQQQTMNTMSITDTVKQPSSAQEDGGTNNGQ